MSYIWLVGHHTNPEYILQTSESSQNTKTPSYKNNEHHMQQGIGYCEEFHRDGTPEHFQFRWRVGSSRLCSVWIAARAHLTDSCISRVRTYNFRFLLVAFKSSDLKLHLFFRWIFYFFFFCNWNLGRRESLVDNDCGSWEIVFSWLWYFYLFIVLYLHRQTWSSYFAER